MNIFDQVVLYGLLVMGGCLTLEVVRMAIYLITGWTWSPFYWVAFASKIEYLLGVFGVVFVFYTYGNFPDVFSWFLVLVSVGSVLQKSRIALKARRGDYRRHYSRREWWCFTGTRLVTHQLLHVLIFACIAAFHWGWFGL